MSKTKKKNAEANEVAQRLYDGNIDEIVARQAEHLEMEVHRKNKAFNEKYKCVPLTHENAWPGVSVINAVVYRATGPGSCIIGRVERVDRIKGSVIAKFHGIPHIYSFGNLLLLKPKGGDANFKDDNPNFRFRRERSYE